MLEFHHLLKEGKELFCIFLLTFSRHVRVEIGNQGHNSAVHTITLDLLGSG